MFWCISFYFCIKNNALLRINIGRMKNVWLFFICNSIFIFPIYISVYSIACTRDKFVFSVCLFSVPIIGGYITREELKFFIHITKRKAFLFDLGKFIKERKKMFKIKGMTPVLCESIIKIGVGNELIYLIPEVYIISQFIPCVINNKMPYMKIKTDFTICKNDEVFLFNKFSFVFNLFSLNAILFNSLVKKGGGKNWKRKIV